ncbi:MAG: sensor histidine kinase [Thiohalocapsa sp.]|nr:sensor histidine kinase [Thiohalocapsa sp.]MCF7991200.1 sensor histidine kinase [Thiohalocapsa sp.]
MHSLANRLHLGLAASLALLIAAAWALGHDALHRSTEAYVLSRLQHDAEALLGALGQDPDGLRQPVREDLMPIYGQPFSGHYFEVVIDDGATIVSRSLWDRDLDPPRIAPGDVQQWTMSGPGGQQLLVRGAGYELAGRRITIAVAEDLTPLVDVLHGFERLFAILAVSGLLLMLLIQRWIVQRTFRRLRPVYRDIDDLERGKKRQLTEDVPIEILPLVSKLNRLLEVYEKRLQRSRNAAGNLAHALKAPLNLMLQQLDRGESPLAREGRTICSQQVQRVRDLVERELKRARIAGSGSPGSVFDPAAELPALREVLLRMYAGKALSIDCRFDPRRPLNADREDMLELFGTLLDNACKWADGEVRCRMSESAGGVIISIEDDGPGCPEAEIAAIGTRGARLDERVAGHGLGLSIAREIVDLYQGTLSLGQSRALGGFEALVELPLRLAQPCAHPQ